MRSHFHPLTHSPDAHSPTHPLTHPPAHPMPTHPVAHPPPPMPTPPPTGSPTQRRFSCSLTFNLQLWSRSSGNQ